MPCWEMIARGRVQGVGLRWFVKDCAIRYGVKGYVKNLSDGTVQIIASGVSEVLSLLAEEIKQGNSHSQIQQLTISELTHYTEYKDFFIV